MADSIVRAIVSIARSKVLMCEIESILQKCYTTVTIDVTGVTNTYFHIYLKMPQALL